MTREEAIKRLKSDIYKYSDFTENPNENEFWTAFDMAIKALEQEPCEDAISRAEAIRIANGYCHWSNIPAELAKLSSVNPKPCEDAISRQAALSMQYRIDDSATLSTRDVVNVDDLDLLPPVTPQPKIGRWIIIDDCEQFIAKCSECGRIEDSRDISKYPYCHCGAKMGRRKYDT